MRPLGDERPRARDEPLFRAIVAAAFSQRRKTLRNAARAFVPEPAYAAVGIDPGRRGETLSVAEFVALADAAHAAGPSG
jgi:16S rRNA (adenine1518-N6/adenine1519-N6)-dimethyltransferase